MGYVRLGPGRQDVRRRLGGANPDHWRYIFLRTKFGIEHAGDAFRVLDEAGLPGVAIISLERGRWDWGNACAMRFQATETPAMIAQKIEDISEHIDQWIIHDGRGRGVEWPSGGPLSRYLDRSRSPIGVPGTYAQIFLSFYGDEDDDERAVELIASVLDGTCLPVMHPEDGRIIFFHTTQVASTVINRFDKHQRELRKLCRWAVCDRTGITLSSDGRNDDAWEPADLFVLTRGG